MTDLHVPDLSKWQAKVDLSKVGPAVILRAHSGRGVDPLFKARQADARRFQKVRGFYLYLVADRDAGVQAAEAASAIGRLLPGEFCVVDVEEGAGNQAKRAEAACAVLDSMCGGRTWVYSGLSFYGQHLAGLNRPLWLAAYRSTEPTAPKHLLWQHTSSEPHPGIGPCDCSIFHGTVTQLRALVTAAPPHPSGGGTPSWFVRTLRHRHPHMAGHDVAQLQVALCNRGRLERRFVTGVYDHETMTALDRWRRSLHMSHGTTFDTATARRFQQWLVTGK